MNVSTCNCVHCVETGFYDLDLQLTEETVQDNPPVERSGTPTIAPAPTHYSVRMGNLLCQWATGPDRVVLYRRYSVG